MNPREKPEPDPRLCRASGVDPHRQQAIRVVLGINASSALRMDLTGARWGLHGAEAILKLRALHSTATSRGTGHGTSPRNAAESTNPAILTAPCPEPPEVPSEEPHPIRMTRPT